jgi:hypothetical protein
VSDEKRLMLKEEIHIRKHRVGTRQPQQVTCAGKKCVLSGALFPKAQKHKMLQGLENNTDLRQTQDAL